MNGRFDPGLHFLAKFLRLPYHLSRKLILNLMNLSNGLSCCQKISFFGNTSRKCFTMIAVVFFAGLMALCLSEF